MRNFWAGQPALFIGIHLLLGAACALYPHPSYGFAFAVLWLPLLWKREWKKCLEGLLIAGAIFLYATHFYPPLDQKKIEGRFYVEIEGLKIAPSPFHSTYLYQGKIRNVNGNISVNLPCTISLPLKKERPHADCAYLIEGCATEKRPYHYAIKPTKHKEWSPVEGTFSLAEWRFQAKEKLKTYLKEHLDNKEVTSFFTALSIGDVDERQISLEFSKVGLQHLLGVSGFHFALLAALFGFFLRLFLPFKPTAVLLLLFLAAYFFFVGNAPAVMRGWIGISVYLFGRLFRLHTTPLNALGVGLCVEICMDPLVIGNMGFQLSFLCTLAILMLYPFMRPLCARLLPQRTVETAGAMGRLDQHGYLLTSLLREALALNLAVHIASLPLILYLFHKFPLQSLLYNLFFPAWSSALFLLLLVALLISFLLPPLGTLLFHCTSALTASLLKLTSHPFPDLSLRTQSLPFSFVVLFLSTLFALTAHFHQKTKSISI